MDLKTWLEAKKGRAALLAEKFGITDAAVSQWKSNGVPVDHMLTLRDFTDGEVSLSEMLEARAARPEKQGA